MSDDWQEALNARVTPVLERALCHAALVIQRLIFLSRSLGLLPKSAPRRPVLSAIDPDEVEIILAGFRRVDATPEEHRGNLLDDRKRVDQIAHSRDTLALELARSPESGLARIARAFALTDRAVDLLVLVLAPDWDLRPGRLFAFLNDDPGADRPRVGHLAMAAHSGLPRPGARTGHPLAELVDSGLVVCGPAERPEASQFARAHESLVALSQAHIARSIATGSWDELVWSEDDKTRLRAAVARELARPASHRVVAIEGPRGSGRAALVRAAAAEAGRAVEFVDLAREPVADPAALGRRLADAAYRARISDAVLAVRGGDDPRVTGEVLAELAAWAARLNVPLFALLRPGRIALISGAIRFVRVQVPQLDAAQRRALWSTALASRDIRAAPGAMEEISGRYSLTPGRIDELADELSAVASPVAVETVHRALRDTAAERIGELATRHEARLTLDDLVLSAPVRTRLDDLVARVRRGHRELSQWIHADRTAWQRAVALVCGPAGTGKSAIAGAVARALGVELFAVDAAAILSKWVGETERNLARLFDEAEASCAGLLFEGIDALFGARPSPMSERHADVTASYLLQRLERHRGIVFFTARQLAGVDPALIRRCICTVIVPAADPAARAQMWRRLLPAGVRYADDVNIADLSRIPGLEGAHIRDALLRATLRGDAGNDGPDAASGRVLTHADLMRAVASGTAQEAPTSAASGGAEGGPEHPYLPFWDELG
ncbi:MAG: ATP-binding protein [Proteobacteria bacterium]|nr:ATP-binding protein [Pseudomonadota bacterium]